MRCGLFSHILCVCSQMKRRLLNKHQNYFSLWVEYLTNASWPQFSLLVKNKQYLRQVKTTAIMCASLEFQVLQKYFSRKFFEQTKKKKKKLWLKMKRKRTKREFHFSVKMDKVKRHKSWHLSMKWTRKTISSADASHCFLFSSFLSLFSLC